MTNVRRIAFDRQASKQGSAMVVASIILGKPAALNLPTKILTENQVSEN